MKLLTQNPKFKKLRTKRSLVGIFSTILNLVALYVILSISHVPNLSSDWGMIFGWQPWQGDGWWKVLLVVLWIFGGTMIASSALINNKNIKQLYPQKDDSEYSVQDIQIPEHLTEEEIVSMTFDISQKMNIEVSGIFVGQNPVPNAFTTFAIDHGNVVFLNSNLLDIMDKESVQSVIAHELGHIKGHDVWYKIGNSIPLQIMRLWILLIALQLIGIMLLSPTLWIFCKRLTFAGVSLLCFGLVGRFLEGYANWYSRLKEKIADAYAVEYTSVEAVMNGLLRLNERSHTLDIFIQTLQKEDQNIDKEVLQKALRNFPTGSKESDYIKKNGLKYYLQAQRDVFLKRTSVKLSQGEKENLLDLMIERRVESEKDEEKKENEQEKRELKDKENNTKQPFVWQDFDWNHDGELQTNELVALIEALKKDPTALTDEEGGKGTHPAIRNRILFIADLYEDVFSPYQRK